LHLQADIAARCVELRLRASRLGRSLASLCFESTTGIEGKLDLNPAKKPPTLPGGAITPSNAGSLPPRQACP
jgi:hypothetical protein